MSRYPNIIIQCGLILVLLCACASDKSSNHWSSANFHLRPEAMRDAVVTIVNYGMDGEISGIGSGFFISKDGTLVTNYHVLEGAYQAKVKTRSGEIFAITDILAENQLVDLMKVRASIPAEKIRPLTIAQAPPAVTDRIYVIGSPMGLSQTISEGIIAAIRENGPLQATIFQITAPISSGSSGGPVLNAKGKVLGIVSFQSSSGQNLNFAVSAKALQTLVQKESPLSVAAWTIQNTRSQPVLAASLCQKGIKLNIQGSVQEALTYFKKATEADPKDPVAWMGLGSCYAGLERTEDAVHAYRYPTIINPENAEAHFVLALYYKVLENYTSAMDSLREVIRIEPEHRWAYFVMGQLMQKTGEYAKGIEYFQKALSLEPEDAATLQMLGISYGQNGEHQKAIEYLKRAIRSDPENAMAHFNIAVAYNKIEDVENELRSYLQAIRVNPRFARPHFQLGRTYAQQGKIEAALKQYEILKKIDPVAAERLFEDIYPDSTAYRQH